MSAKAAARAAIAGTCSAIFGVAATLASACSSPAPDVATGSAKVISNPASLGTLVLRLDASIGVTQTGGAVSGWADQSGQGNDVWQPTAANQPAYHATGAGPGGTLARVSFGVGGATTFLDNTLRDLTPDSADVTVLVAANVPSGGSGGSLLMIRRNDPSAGFMYLENFGFATYIYSDGVAVAAPIVLGSAPLAAGALVLDYTYHLGSPIGFALDGTPIPELAGYGAAAPCTGPTGFTVGAREDYAPLPWEGDIDEMLVYQGVLTADALGAARSYLGSKWGVTTAAPAPDAGACPGGLFACRDLCVPDPTDLSCGTPPLPATWSSSAWFIDPSNSTGVASDSNACTTAADPCLTYAGVAQYWGTYSPRLRQDTTLTFLSSHQDSADPVYFTPYVENGVAVTVEGALGPAQQIASGTLTIVASKNRAAGQLLDVTLPSGAAPGQLVVNTTRGSRAWVYKNDSGNNWFVSQPLVAADLKTLFPAEDDGDWKTNDAVALYQPLTVNLDEVVPVAADGSGSGNFNLNVYQVTVRDPSTGSTARDAASRTVTLGTSVYFAESSIQKVGSVQGGGQVAASGFSNVDIDEAFNSAQPGPAMTYWGGQDRFASMDVGGGIFDGDFIMGAGPELASEFSAPTLGAVFLDTGFVCGILSGDVQAPPGRPMILWGGGSIDVLGTSRLEYPSTAPAAQTFLEQGGLYLDADFDGLVEGTATTGATACSIDTTGSAGWKCSIPLTAANLDAPVSAGGFGGNAINPGGGSISNRGNL